jgi:WD40 repeat protein
MALSFDSKFNEGIVGIRSGSIRFVNWENETNIRLTAAFQFQNTNDEESLQSICFVNGNEENPLFAIGDSEHLSIWSSKTCDLLVQFNIPENTNVVSHPTQKVLVTSTANHLVFVLVKELRVYG